jgi:hypothetical protein
MFAGCSALEEITLPDSVRKIGRNAFRNCKNLEKINLPDSLTDISGDSFEGCEKLPKEILHAIKLRILR